MPTDAGPPAPPVLDLGGLQISYSLVSLVTLTVQNSALTILLHYSRTAPNAKPYSAAAAVLLNEILKGSISLAIALKNVEVPPASSAAHARYSSTDATTSALNQTHDRKVSISGSANSRRQPSLGLGIEESWRKRPISPMITSSRPRMRAWWLDPAQVTFRVRKIGAAVLSPDCWKLAVPACCYVLQNNLQFVAASNLDVATFQVTYQMKILTTAFFSVTMLRKSLSPLKWMCLVALAIGVAIVQLAGTSTAASHSSAHAKMDPLTGFLAVSMACMTSGFAGVYFEKVLKGSTADLWVRNVQLTLFSLPPALITALFPDFSLASLYSTPSPIPKMPDPNAPTWLFGNFGGWALATVMCQVFGGLVTALVIRYSDNIAKGFATSLSILISFLAGVILFNFPVTLPFLVGCSIVLAATWFYNQPETDKGSQHKSKARVSNMYQAVPMSDSVNGSHHASYVDIHTTPPMQRNTGLGLGLGRLGGAAEPDPPYPFAEYHGHLTQQSQDGPPQFINISPFASPLIRAPSEEPVSPKSPVPPSLEGSPFAPSAPFDAAFPKSAPDAPFKKS